MTVDIIIALIAAATAVIGTLSTPPIWVKIALISLAVLTLCAAIGKSYIDYEDKQFVKMALVASLSPSSTEVDKFAWLTYTVIHDDHCNRYEYMHINDGVGIFCYELADNTKSPLPADPFTKVTILTNDNLAHLFATDLEEQQYQYVRRTLQYLGKLLKHTREYLGQFQYLRHTLEYQRQFGAFKAPLDHLEDTLDHTEYFLINRQSDNYTNSQYLLQIMMRYYNGNSESEPSQIHEQIGILGEATFRLIVGVNASGFYNDDTRGVRTYYNFKGKDGELVVDANTIEHLPNEPEMNIFTKIANRFRREIIEQVLK
jgi:hypothetical protein